ncbi:MAG TPA: hypothetical protein VIM02_12885 [Rhizomicrobium sp.]
MPPVDPVAITKEMRGIEVCAPVTRAETSARTAKPRPAQMDSARDVIDTIETTALRQDLDGETPDLLAFRPAYLSLY